MTGREYRDKISKSALSIYDAVTKDLWIPTKVLEEILNEEFVGTKFGGVPIKTRSKIVKSAVCRVLGYPVPKSFKKTKPRFLGQGFDTYTQGGMNLQVWNEDIHPERRYVIFGLNADGIVFRIKVITGVELAKLDKTGTLTKKYQAALTGEEKERHLVVPEDTSFLRPLLRTHYNEKRKSNPTEFPTLDELLPIKELFVRLSSLVGTTFQNPGVEQERNRGAALHRSVCEKLGYYGYQDKGKFPDIRNQLLEVKLQTARTIDLGLVKPDSCENLEIPEIDGVRLRHCDVRYAVFYGNTDGKMVHLTNFYLTTGESFFTRFRLFTGKGINAKLQIPLPNTFFDR